MRHGSLLGLCSLTHVRMPYDSKKPQLHLQAPPWRRRCEGACLFATHKMQHSLRDDRPLPMTRLQAER